MLKFNYIFAIPWLVPGITMPVHPLLCSHFHIICLLH